MPFTRSQRASDAAIAMAHPSARKRAWWMTPSWTSTAIWTTAPHVAFPAVAILVAVSRSPAQDGSWKRSSRRWLYTAAPSYGGRRGMDPHRAGSGPWETGRVPEMPELQAAAERLEGALGGAVVERVVPLSASALKTFDPPPRALVGTLLAAVRRRGKYLILDFGGLVLVIHLMQSGRIMVMPKAPARPRGGLLVVGFGDRGDLL